MRGRVGLHDRLARARATTPTGDLHDEIEAALGGAKIGRVEADVGRNHAGERDRRKIESLRNHLRADENIARRCEFIEQPRVVADARGRIAIHANDPRLRKKFADRLDHFLRAHAEFADRTAATPRTHDRHALLRVAKVAAQEPFRAMECERHATPRAGRYRTARATQHETRGPAAIDEEDGLFTASQSLADCRDERRAEHPAIATFEFGGEIDDVHRRQRLFRRPPIESNAGDLTAPRRRIALERRRRTAEHERSTREPHPFARDGECVVARHAILFVRPLVCFVDDDEPHVWNRREECAARADDDVDIAARCGMPTIETLALRKAGVEHGDAFAENGFEASRGLRRERYFGNQDDRAAAGFDRFCDRPNVDERLAAPGNALDEELRKRARFDPRDDRVDRTRLLVRRFEMLIVATRGAAHGRASLARFQERSTANRPRDDRV